VKRYRTARHEEPDNIGTILQDLIAAFIDGGKAAAHNCSSAFRG
jgi:hypothetical protein